MTSWDERIAEARKNGARVYQQNGLPIVCQRADGALLEHEHADHPDYKLPVSVEFVGEKPDCFHDQCVQKEVRPTHYDHDVEWTPAAKVHEIDAAFCKTCRNWLSAADIVHQRAYSIAEINESTFMPHDEALIYCDGSIALTLYEGCYSIWRLKTGEFLHGSLNSKNWRLTSLARDKIAASRREGVK
jgi:hypothetical protein